MVRPGSDRRMSNVFLDRRRLLAFFGLAPVAAGASVVPAAARPRRDPVRVLVTRVNGESYYDANLSAPTLATGDRVRLARQPDNPYDREAIEVFDAQRRKLGYVARIDNGAVARMMDAGERFEARVAQIDRSSLDIRLEIDWLPA